MNEKVKSSLDKIIQKPISGSRPKGGVNDEGDIPSFGGENLTMSGGINFYPVKKITTNFFNSMKKGHLRNLDVVINKDGANTGKSAIYRNSPYRNAAVNEHLFILRGIEDKLLDQEYLYYLLQSPAIRRIIDTKITGSAQPGINSTFVQNLPIEIQTLPEQKKIASILTSVDEVIENTRAQTNKLQDLKKALLQDLLTKGIGHTKFKNSELGQIPKNWKIKKLKDIGRFSKGKGISKKETSTRGVPCLRYAEIYTDHDIVIKKLKSFIPQEIVNSSKRLRKNDLVFAGSGETIQDIGKSVAFISDSEAYVGGDSIVLSPDSEVNIVFMAYQLNDDVRRVQLRKLGQGSSIIHIYASGLKEVDVFLPPPPEQKKIASILTSVDEVIQDTCVQINKLQSLKKALMHDLLTGKVRVPS